ncbi:hypothetical protein SOCEGT47_055000 [Sorangium cellulosum]|uniref:Uncharacterized protein n=2 Tax=Sorangium cellulosum TaxID=56 RepID=A0A4P2Q6D3_SORCE|nr:hypothetical protein SOCEGT47_055000 [Sorangium cellulosum]
MANVSGEMSTTTRRLAFQRQPHLVDGSGSVGVWLTQPAGMLVQLLRETVTTGDIARFISHDAYQRLVGVMRPDERAFFLYDMALMVRYETEARVILTQWGLNVRDRIEHIVIRPPPEMNKLGRMGIQTIAAAMSLARVPIDIVDDLEPFLRARNLRPRLGAG